MAMAFMGPDNVLGTLDVLLAEKIWLEVTMFLNKTLK